MKVNESNFYDSSPEVSNISVEKLSLRLSAYRDDNGNYFPDNLTFIKNIKILQVLQAKSERWV